MVRYSTTVLSSRRLILRIAYLIAYALVREIPKKWAFTLPSMGLEYYNRKPESVQSHVRSLIKLRWLALDHLDLVLPPTSKLCVAVTQFSRILDSHRRLLAPDGHGARGAIHLRRMLLSGLYSSLLPTTRTGPWHPHSSLYSITRVNWGRASSRHAPQTVSGLFANFDAPTSLIVPRHMIEKLAAVRRNQAFNFFRIDCNKQEHTSQV